MELKLLDLEELRALYRRRLREDFPPAELRPFSSMEYLMNKGAYRCFEAREEGRPLGYALCAVEQGGAALLDYFAVEPYLRGQGVGSRFLRELKALDFGVPYLLIEAESLESAQTPAETEERSRRLRFYRRCGCAGTPVFSLLFGVEYQILVLPLRAPSLPGPAEVQAALEKIYRGIVPPMVEYDEEAFRQVCRVFPRPGAPEN